MGRRQLLSSTPRTALTLSTHAVISPRGFSGSPTPDANEAHIAHVAHDPYLDDPATLKLAQFFRAKGLAALKKEDRDEQWYADWLAYQAEHRIYASVLSPERFSTLGSRFDVLRYARFLETFAYFSPAHGYSAQVSFLGLFAILMGCNEPLKREAVAELECGGVLAFGVSEKTHGSDLLAGDFTITETAPGRFVAGGTKYYIGNSNVAAMIAVLAKREKNASGGGGERHRRAPLVLIALRPPQSKSLRHLRRIRTLGVRAAYVAEFEVKGHELDASDVIAEGRQAWDAVLGTVALGKFFLGFASIGICEHAFEEAARHLRTRILYGKPAIAMPHLRFAMSQAYARLAAMKLYAYRALDYVRAATAQDRRYLLFCAVQKAKVSTEGVKVMSLLSECIGAKGFESDTYFELALRDIQLIPSLESSAHINLGLTAQFAARYFDRFERSLDEPASLVAGTATTGENPHLFEARTGAVASIAFPPFLRAYRAHKSIPNVRRFVRQIRRFRRLLRDNPAARDLTNIQYALAIGQCLATIAYGQLIAENARLLDVPAEMISTIFNLLVTDFSAAALSLASLPQFDAPVRRRIRRMVAIPQTTQAEWDFVAARSDTF